MLWWECRYRNNVLKKDNADGGNKANLIENEVRELVAMVSDMQIGMIPEIHMAIATKSIDCGQPYIYATTKHRTRLIKHQCSMKKFIWEIMIPLEFL